MLVVAILEKPGFVFLSCCIRNSVRRPSDFQVIFVPDYNVSVAEVLIPASELSQHIRCATRRCPLIFSSMGGL